MVNDTTAAAAHPMALAVVSLTMLATSLLGAGHDPRPAPVIIDASEAPAPAEVDPPGIYGADAELAAAIEAAIDRYHTTGLTLPALRIYAHDSSEGCNGANGLFGPEPPVDRIDLCTRLQATVLHELAHAWETHNLSDETRRAFLEHTGTPAWFGHGELEWEDRGIERAAQIVAWGLMDVPITNTARFLDELHQFKMLTGIDSPRT